LAAPQKAAEIGQQIQSLLSNPLRPMVSPPPPKINNFRHGSLVPSILSRISRPIQMYLRPSSFLSRFGMIEVGR